MFLHRVGAELLLITLTLWLQSAGVAALRRCTQWAPFGSLHSLCD
jgi:hypothetical protein